MHKPYEMARLFTINISFQNHDYPALVTLHNKGHDISCLVRYIDKGISNLLPGGVLKFSLVEGLEQPHDLMNPTAEELVHCTTEAIAKYLYTQD